MRQAFDEFNFLPPLFKVFGGGKSLPPMIKFGLLDILAVFIILASSFSVRFHKIDFPDKVVFDEVYFAYFAEQYNSRKFFFDIHPAFGRLFLYSSVKMIGHDFNCKPRVSERWGNCSYTKLRIPPAFCGSLVPAVLFFAIRFMGCNTAISFGCSFVLSLDGSFFLHSKYSLIDAILHFFAALSILSLFINARTLVYSRGWWISLIIHSIFVGLTASIKHTALGILVFSAFWSFVVSESFRTQITRIFILLFGYVFCNLSTTAAHVIILQHHGQDETYVSLNYSYYLTLVNDPPIIKQIGILEYVKSIAIRTIELTTMTFLATNRVPAEHPSSSSWYEWPLGIGRPVRFIHETNALMCAMFNPVSHILSFLSFIVAVFSFSGNNLVSTLVIGYLANWLPFSLIGRACFAYHYAIPLEFLLCLMAVNLQRFNSEYFQSFIITFLFLTSIIVFIWFSPYYYYTKQEDITHRLFYPTWRSLGSTPDLNYTVLNTAVQLDITKKH